MTMFAVDLTLAAATLLTGLMAGIYLAFSVAVMPGLGRAEDRTFVEAVQHINQAILNPWFLLVFLGAPLLTVAAVAQVVGNASAALPWTVAGLVLHVVAVGVTGGVNVPLNNAILAAGAPTRAVDLADVRASFESPWVRANLVRTLTSTAALGCLVWAVRSL